MFYFLQPRGFFWFMIVIFAVEDEGHANDLAIPAGELQGIGTPADVRADGNDLPLCSRARRRRLSPVSGRNRVHFSWASWYFSFNKNAIHRARPKVDIENPLSVAKKRPDGLHAVTLGNYHSRTRAMAPAITLSGGPP